MSLHELTIAQARELLDKKEISSKELTSSVFDQIERVEDKVDAFLTISKDEAEEQADAADKRIAAGDISPLTGIPLAIKDVICTKGVRTTCASKILENFIPPYDANVMEKLNAQGAVMVGKSNMDEFAMGASTEFSGFKPTKNPWDLSRIPGGSSGGSAAAVAADMCIGSIGSDTGGSVRQPASHCGVVGMKPTYGRVSRYGLVAFASSLDQIGPFGKSVEDVAVLMNAISGFDERDSTSIKEDVPDFTKSLSEGMKGMKIGLPREYFEAAGLDEEVKQLVNVAIDKLVEMGAEKVEISLPQTEYVVSVYYIIAPCEASSNLARYDGVRYGKRADDAESMIDMFRKSRSRGFGDEVQRRIIIGTYSLSSGYYDAYYGKASQVRTLIIEDFKDAFEKCDVMVSPVAPEPASLIGEMSGDPLKMYTADIFTVSANLAGIPGMSVPCGFTKSGLPVGLQIMGKHFNEEALIKTAYNYEKAAGINGKKPVL